MAMSNVGLVILSFSFLRPCQGDRSLQSIDSEKGDDE